MLTGQGLATVRGERLVFAGVDFSIAAGGAMVLVGPNGAGKSTLLRLMAGLGRAEAGRLLWHGEDALVDRVAHARRVAYLGHLDAVKPGLTVMENLAFHGSPAAAMRALGAMELAQLADLPARMLSAGQKRRLALARVAMSAAPIWLLDEPTLGLDTGAVARLGALLAAHRAGGGLVAAATHLPLPLPDAVALPLGSAA